MGKSCPALQESRLVLGGGKMTLKNNKSLGQHWLKDRLILDAMVEFAGVEADDTVLEIGPGLGTLTSAILRRAERVVAVEFDAELARKLPAQFPGKKLEVINSDILQFDLSQLPAGYKVVANLPYYITAKIVNYLISSLHRPASITILIQKEVAERIAQVDGSSILGLAVENYATVELGDIIGPEWFTPPPQVDSQIIRLDVRPQPLITDAELERAFFRVIKAGFGAKRKKLRSSLAGGLALDKADVERLLAEADINPDWRAEDLNFEQFLRLTQRYLANQ